MWIEKERTLIKRILLPFKGVLAVLMISTIISTLLGNHWQFSSFLNFLKANGFGVSIGLVFWLANWAIANFIRTLDWRKNPIRANLISLLLFITSGIVASILVPYVFSVWVWHVPAEKLLQSITISAFICLTADLIVVSIYYSRYMVFAWQKSIENEEHLKRETLIAKFEALKNQVNPHFLFNTLNTLAGVVEQTPEHATEFINRFAKIYRYVLEQREKDLVPLHDELSFLENYIYLSKIRHGEGLNVHIALNPDNMLIVPMGLQILFENAIKHNLITDEEPLTVEIGFETDYIFIRNNLQSKNSIEVNSKIGLDNLTKRYQYLSKLPVLIHKTDAIFEVKLPVILNK